MKEISLEEAKALLGDLAQGLTDEEIAQLNDCARVHAQAIVQVVTREAQKAVQKEKRPAA